MLYKKKWKRISAFLLLLAMMLGLTACSGNEEKRYQTYIKSLIAINYLGATKDYIEASGANETDAQNLYNANIELLTDNLLTYYGVKIDDAPEMRTQFEELAKHIYSKVNYKVDKARKDGSVYLVDITIYPINLFQQTADEVVAYVDAFNADVKAGVYNDYTLSEYETVFAQGLLDILNTGCENMTYADPEVVTVEIVEEGDKFYIKDRDFIAIDSAMISSAVTVEPATGSDTTE